MVPKIFEGLVASDRPVLMELTEDAESTLTSAVCHLAGVEHAASRAATWNGCDLRTSSGIKLTLRLWLGCGMKDHAMYGLHSLAKLFPRVKTSRGVLRPRRKS